MLQITESQRIMEWLGLEGTLKLTLFHPLCHGQGHPPRLLQAPSKLSYSSSFKRFKTTMKKSEAV